jgi:hypothetical protein
MLPLNGNNVVTLSLRVGACNISKFLQYYFNKYLQDFFSARDLPHKPAGYPAKVKKRM